ncbi:MAG: phage holin family protein [Minisyncoccales bacterium]
MSIFIGHILIGILGFWISENFIPGVAIEGGVKFLAISGLIFGILNFFVKPILDFLSFPLKILTFGLFSLILNMFMIWVIDVILVELTINGIVPLFWTTVVLWGLNFLYKGNQLRKN